MMECLSFVASSGKGGKCEIITNNMKVSGCDGIRSDTAMFVRGTEKTHEISVRIAGLCAEKRTRVYRVQSGT